MLYAVLNPVAAGICRNPCDYRWSSCRATLSLPRITGPVAVSDWITATFACPLPGARRAYRELVRAGAELAWERRSEAKRAIRAVVADALPARIAAD